MNIGIPNEVSAEERRIALTPVGVYALTQEGHAVYVEQGAGKSCGFSDQEFREVGAQLVYSREEVFHRAELIAKIQLLNEEECSFLDSGDIVFSSTNLGITHKPVIDKMIQRKITALGYEFSEQPGGVLPILSAMSEIAGVLLPQIAGRFLQSNQGGRGITLAGLAGVAPANVVILGAGAVGFNAARSFSALGAQVLVLDRDVTKLRTVDRQLNKRISTSIFTPLLLERAVRFADVLVGGVFIRGRKTPHLVSEKMVKEMKPGSVIIDVSIDQGGCIETSRPTTLSSPTYVKHGVTHYCVPNIPASVARAASHAMNNSVLPWVLQICRIGFEAALQKYSCLQSGIYLYRGEITLKSLSDLFGYEHKEIEQS